MPGASMSMGSMGQSSMADMVSIPEFVQGKPWQGLQEQLKNVENDPHMTPGSAQQLQQQRFSLNVVKTDHLEAIRARSAIGGVLQLPRM